MFAHKWLLVNNYLTIFPNLTKPNYNSNNGSCATIIQWRIVYHLIWDIFWKRRTSKKILRPHYIILYNKIKPRKFEVCNRQCFESRFRMNQDSMGSVDPDPDPSRSKWFLKIGQKQRNILFEELSGGVSLSQECEHLSCWGVKKYLYVGFLLNFFQFLS
jgi:hypothetical protein